MKQNYTDIKNVYDTSLIFLQWKIILSTIIAVALFMSCAQTQGNSAKIPIASNITPTSNEAVLSQLYPGIIYKAEGEHQEYISQNPDNGYVQNVAIPEFYWFKKEFKEGVFK